MGDVIDFQKYKDEEEIAILVAGKVIKEFTGEIEHDEVIAHFKKIPTKYLSRLLFALDMVIDEADIDNNSIKETEIFSDALADIITKRLEALGVKQDED